MIDDDRPEPKKFAEVDAQALALAWEAYMERTKRDRESREEYRDNITLDLIRIIDSIEPTDWNTYTRIPSFENFKQEARQLFYDLRGFTYSQFEESRNKLKRDAEEDKISKEEEKIVPHGTIVIV